MANFRNRYYTHRKRNRYYSHGHTSQGKTIRTGYAVNTQIVLQITDKQREKLTGSKSDSSSDRISLSRTPKIRCPQWVRSLIGKTDLGFRVFVAAKGRSVCLKEQRRISNMFDLRSLCLKEQRRIGGLNFYRWNRFGFYGFLLQLKADLCVWRNREEYLGWVNVNFDRRGRFGI